MGKCKAKALNEYNKELALIEADSKMREDELLSLYDIPDTINTKIANLADRGVKQSEDMRGWRPAGTNFARMFQGIYVSLSNSDSYAVRGLNSMLFENPQGKNDPNINTASVESAIIRNQALGEMGARYYQGYNMYLKDNNLSWRQSINPKHSENFNKLVYMNISKPDPNASKAVKTASDGFRDTYEYMGTARKNSGESGFQDLEVDRNYVTKILSSAGINNAISKATKRLGFEEGESAVRMTLAKAYMNGKNRLPPDVALAIAEAKIKVVKDGNLTMRNALRAVKNSDLDAIEKILRKGGLNDEDLASFMDTASNKEVKTHMSNRARDTLNPDVSVEFQGVRAVDLFNTDMEFLGESYVREGSASVALARKGFLNNNQIEETIAGLEKHMLDTGMPRDVVTKEISMLSSGVKLIQGQNIEEAGEAIVKGGAFVRGWTTLIRLQNTGFYSFPELARNVTSLGIKNNLRAIPSLREIFVGSSGKRGGNISGKFSDPDLMDADFLLRYAGEERVTDFRGIANDTLEEQGNSRMMKIADKVRADAQYLQHFTSFMKTFQSTGETIVSRSATHSLKDYLFNGNPLKFRDADLGQMGWSKEWLEDLKSRVKPIKVEHEGKSYNMIDYSTLGEEDIMNLRVGIYRLTKTNMQGQLVGEESEWMNKTLGKYLTQFKSFSIASFDKQLLRDFRFDKVAMAQTMAMSAGMSLLMHGLYSGVRSVGMSESKREKFLENQFSPMGMTLGTIGRMGQLASLGIGMDALNQLNITQDPMRSRSNQAGSDLLTNAIPSAGVVQDVVKAGTTPFEILRGDAEFNDLVDRMQYLVPPANTVGVANVINYTQSLLE